jgi:hypothetical protein
MILLEGQPRVLDAHRPTDDDDLCNPAYADVKTRPLNTPVEE